MARLKEPLADDECFGNCIEHGKRFKVNEWQTKLRLPEVRAVYMDPKEKENLKKLEDEEDELLTIV